MLRLDPLFSGFAVLQRGKAIKVWGTGREGSTVQVSIQGRTGSGLVAGGKWVAELPPLTASTREEMTVQDGAETIVVSNMAVGEVWIAGGQSNMEFPMRNLKEFPKLKSTNEPLVRLYGVPRISYPTQMEDDDFSEYQIWRPCTPENLWFYSAVPFYFALKLFERYRVPIGILNCNVGGTQASSWAERAVLEKSAAKVWIDEYNEKTKDLDLESYRETFLVNPFNKVKAQDHSAQHDKMWKGYSDLEMLFVERRIQAMFKKMPFPPMGPMDRNCPTTLYENMVKKIAPYGARGVIWYQGESDDPHADVYDAAMGAVIDSWRALWNEALPFLMVQLAPYEGFMGFPAMNYVLLREKQILLSKTKDGVYAANIMDAGMRHDIHPKQKKPVAERLALLARGRVYGEDILCEAPEVSWYEKKGEEIVITFANCGEGLVRKGRETGSLEVSADGRPVKCAIRLEGNRMILRNGAFSSADEITVKYGRKNWCLCNIRNSAGIPVNPFEFKMSGEA